MYCTRLLQRIHTSDSLQHNTITNLHSSSPFEIPIPPPDLAHISPSNKPRPPYRDHHTASSSSSIRIHHLSHRPIIMTLTFVTFTPTRPTHRQTSISMCDARPPNDPTNLRTESQRRRNSPPKPLRRRRRRDTDPIDWDSMTSVPLVRPEADPETGEDYWWELDKSVKLGDPDLGNKPRKKREIDPNLKSKLRDEVVSPYTQNWILRVALLVLVLVVAVWVFGGEDTIPIIKVPDL